MVITTQLSTSALGQYKNQPSSDGGLGSIGQTQTRRGAERFNIIDWIRGNQATIAAQNAKAGRGGGGGSGPYPDLVFSYTQNSGPVVRDNITLGKDTRIQGRAQFLLDDLFMQGNRKRAINIDIGVEGFLGQTTSFQAEPNITQLSHSYNELGGGLVIRPFGRSSQDTGLLLKGGYVNLAEKGLWANNENPVTLYGYYAGAETKIYLLNFLGIYGEYQNILETKSDALVGKWKMQRFTYGAFLEIFLIHFDAYLMNTELIFTPEATSTAIKETYTGVGFTGTLYF